MLSITTYGTALRPDGRIGILAETRCPINQPGRMTWTDETYPATAKGEREAVKRITALNAAAVPVESEALAPMTAQDMADNFAALRSL